MDFSGKQFPKSVIMMAVRWYLAYPLSYRHIEELVAEFGIMLDHASVQRWVAEFGIHLHNKVRKYLTRNFKRSWRLDETYIKVQGKWCYLYRMVDKDGDSISFHLSKTRDHKAALKCIRSAIKLAVSILNQELSNQWHASHPEFCGPQKKCVVYTKFKYCNNIIEQDHRRIKRIVDPMMGFKNFDSATSTIAGIEAIAMLRKQQTVFSSVNGIEVSIADQIDLLAA